MKTLILVSFSAVTLTAGWLYVAGSSPHPHWAAVVVPGDTQEERHDEQDTAESPVGSTAEDSAASEAVSYRVVLSLLSRDESIVDAAISKIDDQWHPGVTVMLVETLRFVRNPYGTKQTIRLLHSKTGQRFGTDYDSWFQWIWKRPYRPHPEYAEFKGKLYSRLDRRFAAYFRQPDNARIRLDEIRWGGVKRDGIPPLKNPKMIPAAQAEYLADSDVVFGVNLNGDARCYPKRILAWHEMFKDTIGGMSVCGAY